MLALQPLQEAPADPGPPGPAPSRSGCPGPPGQVISNLLRLTPNNKQPSRSPSGERRWSLTSAGGCSSCRRGVGRARSSSSWGSLSNREWRGGGLGEFPSAREALPLQPRPSSGEGRRGRRGGFSECLLPTLSLSRSGVPSSPPPGAPFTPTLPRTLKPKEPGETRSLVNRRGCSSAGLSGAEVCPSPTPLAGWGIGGSVVRRTPGTLRLGQKRA